MTRALALSLLFALALLTIPGDSLYGQPPPAPGTVSWATGYPGTYDPVGPPFPKEGGVTVSGALTPPTGTWMVSQPSLMYKLQAGGVTYSVPLNSKDGAIGAIDPQTGKCVPTSVAFAKGEWAVWLSVVYSRINPIVNQPEIVPVTSSFKNVSVK